MWLLRGQDKNEWRNLWLAVGASLLLHFFLLEVLSLPERAVSGAGQGGGVPLTATLLGSKQGNISDQSAPDLAVAEPSEALVSAKPESSVQPVAPVVPSGPVGVPSVGAAPIAVVPQSVTPVLLSPRDDVSYFRRSQLTVPPVLQGEPVLDAPPGQTVTLRKGDSVTLRLFVNANGSVERIEVENSTLPEAYEQQAVAAFLPMQFRPGEIEGVAVRSQVVFEVDFDNFLHGASRTIGNVRLNGSPEKKAR